MLIGVIADTHDNMNMLKKAVDLFNERAVALVLHAGDYIAPFTAREFRRLNCKLVGVFGNNDGEKFGLAKQLEGFGQLHEGIHQLELSGKMVAITHYPEIAETLSARRCYDVVIYGHTHRAEIREPEPLVINPGECGGWLEGESTVAILDIDAMRAQLVKL
ncbi:MAG: metallophosphoesterase [Candidatus Hydrogenedentota bacterium]|nr:MAG: metallophosphoesterase [Candidatus Hydrogenedentota bacterium]